MVLSVQYGALTTNASFAVLSPGNVSVRAADSTLNALVGSSGSTCGACAARSPFQTTRVRAFAQSAIFTTTTTTTTFDVTNVVTFTSSAPSVASVGSGPNWNLVSGKSVGVTTVYLGVQSIGPSTTIVVSSTPVRVVSMTSRIVTGMAWQVAPTSTYAYSSTSLNQFQASVALQHQMNAEGSGGYVFSTAKWSDNALEDVDQQFVQVRSTSSNFGVAPAVMSATPNLTTTLAPWKVSVANDAVGGCFGTQVVVNWTTCGCALALAFAPALVQLPTATSAVLSSDQSRLSPPDDQASTMLSVASYATLTLTTSFSDGSRRVMTSDPRVTYSTQSARCGTVSTGRAYATSGARGASCTQIVVTAIVSLGGKNVTSSTSIALV